MSKRKREDENLIEGYNPIENVIEKEIVEEFGAFKPIVEIFSADSDSSLLAPKKAPIPKKMLPRHLQKPKAYQPKKVQIQRVDQSDYPSFQPPYTQNHDNEYNEFNNNNSNNNNSNNNNNFNLLPPPILNPPMPNTGFGSMQSGANPFVPPIPQPMPYYGEVPLQPLERREEKIEKPKVQSKKFLRTAGADIWEDPTLAEWSKDDYRIFVGNLGNEVTDDGLKRAFMQYKSLSKARVVRDKRNFKSKGYGFVSFLEPHDFLRAMKEMQGKYVANRPCKLSKSKWDARNLDKFREKYGDPICIQEKKERLEKIQTEAKKQQEAQKQQQQLLQAVEDKKKEKKEKQEKKEKESASIKSAF